MDIFDRQVKALARSRRLIPLFLLALPGVIGAVYLMSLAAYSGGRIFLLFWNSVFAESTGQPTEPVLALSFWHPTLFAWVAGSTTALVIGASFQKIRQLSRGGHVVAELLGGQRLQPNASKLEERRLLNVVEEMSIASGIPVPDVYVLRRENGVNAFAAGHSIHDAVVGVTDGCLRHLTRDELQGVIAHEFSHVLNGDMRLNTRLMGMIHELFALMLVSEAVMATTYDERDRDLFSESHPSGGIKLARDLVVLVGGLILAFIGYQAAFFGRIIQAAVSRQREFLADAAAVQFTRYPSGLAGALNKVRWWSGGTDLHSPQAEEAGHMFFVNGLSAAAFRFTATHPPIAERIRRLDPFLAVSQAGSTEAESTEPRDESATLSGPAESAFRPASATPIAPVTSALAAIPAENAFTLGGIPTREFLAQISVWLASLPGPITEAARTPQHATAVIYLLLISSEESAAKVQLDQLAVRSSPELMVCLRELIPLRSDLPDLLKIPLVEIAMPALRHLPEPDYRQFMDNVQFLVASDRQVDLFEFALQQCLRRHLEPAYRGAFSTPVRFYALKPILYDCALLFSALAHAGNRGDQVPPAFAAGVRFLNQSRLDFKLVPEADCTLRALEFALDHISEVSLENRKLVLGACAQIVASDGRVQPGEFELLRAIADAVDCPMPPLECAGPRPGDAEAAARDGLAGSAAAATEKAK